MLEATTKPCPHCHGMGVIRSDDSLALAILREVEEEALRGRSDEITVCSPVDIANYLINAKRRHIGQIEHRNTVLVVVIGDPTLVSPNYEILRSKSALEGERKQVTVLFVDVKDSMRLASRMDPEAWHRILDRFFEKYLEDNKREPMPFLEWVDTVYDPVALKRDFRAAGWARRLVDEILKRE